MRLSKSPKKKPGENRPPADLEEQIIDALRTIYDPEIPVNIYEMGLVYGIDAKSENVVVRMTLTSPGCPVAGSLPIEVKSRVLEIEGVKSVKVELVWDPPWNPDMISEAGKLQLGLY
jgi:FeS assembly SUF system protein